MDLIYTDEAGTDIGVIDRYTFDYEAMSVNDNTFELSVSLRSQELKAGYYLYVDGTEYGGRIDSIKVDTSKKAAYYRGRTWRGILGSKIIEPPAGEAYYVVSGEANAVLGQIIRKTALGELFHASEEDSGINIRQYQFARYTDAYTGIIKMLAGERAKLRIVYRKGKASISAVPISDFSEQSEVTSDLFDFVLEDTPLTVNHVIGLGRGELTERQVVHRYLDADGNISDRQQYTGMDEITKLYENTNIESVEELAEETENALAGFAVESGIKITAYNLDADIGDKFTAREMHLGIAVSQYVTNKIVKIENGKQKISYKVGEII